MDWTLAITRNREALQRIVVALMALAGFGSTLVPRQAYRAVLKILRPAESAVRRLIVIVAHGLTITPRMVQPFPAGFAARAGQIRPPLFRLIDPLKRFNISPFEPLSGPPPRISVPGYCDPVFPAPHDPDPEQPVSAEQLQRRLAALKRVLDNLPRAARRLARWQARRGLALQQRRRLRLSAFRPGHPPGYRSRPVHEIDGILRECHALALDRMAGADTS